MSDDQQEKVPELKKQNSYTYWVNNDPNFKGSFKQDSAPVKLQVLKEELVPEAAGPSSWNKAGTWEQRKLKIDQVNSKIQESVKQVKFQGLKFKNTESEGQVCLLFTGGKRKMTYNIKVTINCQSEEEKSCSLKFTQFSDDGDREIELKGSSAQKGKLSKLQKAAEQKIILALKSFL